jgi:cell division protein FtsL
MTGLEQTFYIMAIIFMTVMFLLMVALVVAVFAIRAKIHEIERNITEKIASKLSMVTNLFSIAQKFAGITKRVVQHRQS